MLIDQRNRIVLYTKKKKNSFAIQMSIQKSNTKKTHNHISIIKVECEKSR